MDHFWRDNSNLEYFRIFYDSGTQFSKKNQGMGILCRNILIYSLSGYQNVKYHVWWNSIEWLCITLSFLLLQLETKRDAKGIILKKGSSIHEDWFEIFFCLIGWQNSIFSPFFLWLLFLLINIFPPFNKILVRFFFDSVWILLKIKWG